MWTKWARDGETDFEEIACVKELIKLEICGQVDRVRQFLFGIGQQSVGPRFPIYNNIIVLDEVLRKIQLRHIGIVVLEGLPHDVKKMVKDGVRVIVRGDI